MKHVFTVRACADAAIAILVALGTFVLYVATLAPTVLRSDSGEFHVVPWVLGIAHAPGYPLLTLLGRLAMFLPLGDPAYRVSLLDAAAAAAGVACVYLAIMECASAQGKGARGGTGRDAEPHPRPRTVPVAIRLSALIGALALGLGATYWQQSVVGGPRPFVFFFTALLLWLLFRWGNRRGSRDLALLAGAAGLALAHHPNQAMLFPGLGIYLLVRDPGLLRRPRHLALAVGAFALPLLLYLYLPIRSPMEPPLGTSDLGDPRELLIYVTARNYQEAVLSNCGGSRLLQAQRYAVLFLLQFGPGLAVVSAFGAVLTLVLSPLAGFVLLYAFLSNSVFGICSTLAMPDYIIPSYVVAAIWLGLALDRVLGWLAVRPSWRLRTAPAILLAGLAFGVGAYRIATGLPYQSMLGRTADADRARAGMAQAQPNGIILSDWESITPLWYAQHVLGINRRTKTAMVTAPPGSDAWVIEAGKAIENRPVSLAQRVPALQDRYRLFPIGSLYDVPEKSIQERAGIGLLAEDRSLRVLGYHLDRPAAEPGALIHLTLYQKAERGRDTTYLPVLRLASDPPVEFRFDGELHYPSSTWADNEVVGEVYELSLPTWLAPGELPLELAYRVAGRDELIGLAGGRPWTQVATVQITAPTGPSLQLDGAVANFSNQLVLRGGSVAGVPLSGSAEAVRARRGGVLNLEVRWSALRWMDDSYTLFVHLLDGRSQLVAQNDALPLGGIYHTYKWVPGQMITDWYRLPISPDLPAGEYWLEIGAYHSATTRRLRVLDASGGSDRTSLLWGPIRVE